MAKPGYFAIVLLLLVAGACGRKEAEKEAGKEAAPAKPAFTPGEMVLVPGGEFVFGENDKEKTSYPEQKIDLPAFWIDKYEVTNGEYLQYCIDASYVSEGNWRLFFSPEKVGCPVVNITWNDAVTYCQGKGKRLPTEPEWEKAARGTDGRRYPWGEKWEPSRSNTYEASMRGPTAVNTFNDVSPYEAHDMLGNRPARRPLGHLRQPLPAFRPLGRASQGAVRLRVPLRQGRHRRGSGQGESQVVPGWSWARAPSG
ncbi:MAG: hypothetical protein DMG07_28980 [Acidobacteria bacterium]|nr:MAG: hypothetical protein DMG07_28980 [Acidobacteriota bacterium]